MKNKFRRYISVLFISLFTISLVACVNVSTSTDIKINKDGSSTTDFKIIYEDKIKSLLPNGILKEVLGDGVEVNIYSEGTNIVEKVNFTTPKIEIKDILGLIALKKSDINAIAYDPSDFINYSINREKGFLKDNYTVNINLTKDIMEEVNIAIENGIENNLTDDVKKYIFNDFTTFLTGNIYTYAENYISEIPYDLTISLPFKITNSNATLQIDEYTSQWNYTIKDLNPNTEISLSFIAPNIVNIGLIALTVLIIIIVIIVIVIKNRRKK